MDLPLDMKKQLMQMAGITDVKEFDQMAEKIAGSASNTIKKAQSQRQSPFQGKNPIVFRYQTIRIPASFDNKCFSK